MINLFIGTDCLAFPPQAEEPILEHNNIEDFLCGIRDLDMLINSNPNIVVSIRREIEDFLEKEKSFFDMNNDQKDRILRQRRLKIDFRSVERIYPTLFRDTRTIRYTSINAQNNSTCGKEPETIAAYISCLKDRYNINNQRLVVNTIPQNRQDDTVRMCKPSKLEKECNYTKRFDTFKAAFEKIKNDYSGTICFGDDIYTNKESLLLRNSGGEFNSPDIPDRLFYYLDNLSAVARYLQSLPDEVSEKNIVDIVTAFGCNSAPEKKCKDNNCRHRNWHNGNEKSVFHLHLRPRTGSKTRNGPDDRNTMRIYFAWRKDIKKFAVGMICTHPPLCYPDGCDSFDECNTRASETYRPFAEIADTPAVKLNQHTGKKPVKEFQND